MEWRDEALVLGTRPHAENAAVVRLLSADEGLYAGLVAGGQGRRLAPVLQSGNLVQARWYARLPEHLGRFEVELSEPLAAGLIADADALAAWGSASALLLGLLPEREPHPEIFGATRLLLDGLTGPHWGELTVRWELGLLAALGFALDLTRCAGGGSAADLIYVSPRSGSAVSREAGAPYAERLLTLPGFLVGRGADGPAAVLDGLKLTGHFLARDLFGPKGEDLPDARHRLVERVRRQAESAA